MTARQISRTPNRSRAFARSSPLTGAGHAAGQVAQRACEGFVAAHPPGAGGVAVIGHDGGHADQRTGGDGDEERLEIVRVQELHSLGASGPRHGARAGQVEARRAFESQRAQAAPPRFGA